MVRYEAHVGLMIQLKVVHIPKGEGTELTLLPDAILHPRYAQKKLGKGMWVLGDQQVFQRLQEKRTWRGSRRNAPLGRAGSESLAAGLAARDAPAAGARRSGARAGGCACADWGAGACSDARRHRCTRNIPPGSSPSEARALRRSVYPRGASPSPLARPARVCRWRGGAPLAAGRVRSLCRACTTRGRGPACGHAGAPVRAGAPCARPCLARARRVFARATPALVSPRRCAMAPGCVE